ncbi:CD109 antigen isoform X1 [Diachasma alloeum]|uniref:CD109 antigen isoform X1 n=1 Tax=Diachasma alloeum TaxID=454923 RepID=UPI00073829A3|nr:CD109 antigen isoform X1 [Diachasma alloeum]
MRTLFPVFLTVLATVTAEPYYTVVAPKVVRPNSEYHVVVSTTGVSAPSTIVVELDGELDNGEVFRVFHEDVVEPYQTRVFKLDIGDTTPGRYHLTAKGVNGLLFSNTTDVQYMHKSYSVFIQTDRAVYKPGSKVLFRCIVLDSRLRPALTRQLDVYITDGSGNRIKQWTRPSLTRGIFTGELELSSSPVLGDWKIITNVVDQTFEKPFQVAEYVLPKFQVSIDVPKHSTFKSGKVIATIRADYTYGKPVKGEATITAYPDFFSGVLQPIFTPPVRKVLPIDGKVTVDFDIASELKLSDEYERPIEIEATVEEALTGRRQNVSTQMTLHKHKYTMELIKTSEYYKPGLKYTAFIKIAHHDGSPVRDRTNAVVISYGYTFNQSAYTNITRMLDDNGMIQLDFYPPVKTDPDDVASPLNIEAEYLNLHEWFPATNQAMSPSGSYIQAVVRTESPRVNHEVEVEVNSTEVLKYLHYEVLGRGDILYAGSVSVDGKVGTFRFLATYVMAPTAHVLVYYTKENGEVVADALDVELEGTLQNFVEVSVKPGETGPGQTVDLNITSRPNSFVGVLGVDQRSLLLKSGNDISREDVMRELRGYDMSEESPYDGEGWRMFWRPGSATAQDVFDKTGTVILTNAHVPENFPMRRPGYLEGRVRGSGYGESTLRPDIGPPVIHRLVTRPPLAGPYAFSRIPTPVWNRPRVFLMHDISNTWLFTNFSSGLKGETVLRKTVPDSITSWVITAFSVDSTYGLGLIEAPRKLKVFKPFFVSVDLPYSVMRGEIVAIPIVVFNYMDRDITADVTIEHSGQFEFAEVSNEVHDNGPKLELYRTKRVDVKANSGAGVSFMVIPRELGYIPLKATATSKIAGDSVEHKLLVKAEGETQYRNRAVFLDLRTVSSLSTNITVDIPKNIVPGSEHIEISAVGDILGPSIPNLESLIKLPFGCGEQNMLNLVPNIVILNYLKNTNQLTQAVQGKALRYLEVGYQQELTYRHKDGSFSAFGESDESGSTWLTAFVAKSFKQASEYIIVEDRIINEALLWLSNVQTPNGSFPEVGRVSHKDMQGGAAKGLALTAYTLTAFLENPEAQQKYRNTINKGVDYIVRNMEGLDDLYALSICVYVLNLAKHPYEDVAFGNLEFKATTKDDMKWWNKTVDKDDKNPWFDALPRSVDVEMTSYTLMTYLQRNLVSDAIPVMKWLVKQRNPEGGFSSTQDTVVGIYALSKLGERLLTKNNNIAITINYEGGGRSTMNINGANAMILQKHVLPKKTRVVNITASGNGFAIIQVSTQFNLNVTGAWPLFTLDPQVDKNSNENHLQLSICSGFVPTKESNESNMAVMEVSLPSGFTVDRDSLPSLEVSQNVKRVETRNGDTMVVLYFDKMVRKEYCPTVSAFRTHKVAKQKPVPVSIYDYYDSSRRARVFYEPRVSTLCDICEGEDCGDLCTTNPSVPGTQKSKDPNGSSPLHTCTYLLLIPVYLMLARH